MPNFLSALLGSGGSKKQNPAGPRPGGKGAAPMGPSPKMMGRMAPQQQMGHQSMPVTPMPPVPFGNPIPGHDSDIPGGGIAHPSVMKPTGGWGRGLSGGGGPAPMLGGMTGQQNEGGINPRMKFLQQLMARMRGGRQMQGPQMGPVFQPQPMMQDDSIQQPTMPIASDY